MATSYDLLTAPTSQTTKVYTQQVLPDSEAGYTIQLQVAEGVVVREILSDLHTLTIIPDYQLIVGDYFDIRGELIIEGTLIYV
jgi:hypothetical protein